MLRQEAYVVVSESIECFVIINRPKLATAAGHLKKKTSHRSFFFAAFAYCSLVFLS